MALLKKKKSDPAAAPSAAPEGDSPKKGGMLVMLLAPVLVFGTSFGVSTVLGTGGSAPAPVIDEKPAPTAATHSVEWSPSEPAKTVSLETMAITAGPQGQTLRIGLAVEVWDNDAELDQLRLRDAFTTYLRALDPDQLGDPSFHVRMKRALLHRARVVEGQDVVADVLITDFLLTG